MTKKWKLTEDDLKQLLLVTTVRLNVLKKDYTEDHINKKAKVLTQAEIKRFLRVVSTTKHEARNRLIVMFSYMAGLRACEIAALRVGDVINELKDGTWEVKSEAVLKSNQTKGNKAQTVVFNSTLRKEIASYYAHSEETLEVTDFSIISQKKSGFSSQTIQNLFRELYQSAGIAVASSHSGRHFFITEISQKISQCESFKLWRVIAVLRLLSVILMCL